MIRFILAAAIMVLASAQGAAQDRYQLQETKHGMVRLDRHTGAVSHCRKVGASLACSMAADERDAMMADNEDLTRRIEALAQRITALEHSNNDQNVALARGKSDGSLVAEGVGEPKIDKVMRITERVVRRFIAVLKELTQELGVN